MPRLLKKVAVITVVTVVALPLSFGLEGANVSEPLASVLQCTESPLPLSSIKGVWYLGWTKNAYTAPKIAEELIRLKFELGVNYVGLIIPLLQDSLESTDPRSDPGRTPSLDTLAYVIDEAHKLGLGIVLLPYLLVKSKREFEGKVIEDWVGDLRPQNVGAWFQNWREILRRYAAFAEETDVEILLIGWEFETMLRHHDEWRTTISQLRHLYDGQLSYLTNWWADRDEYARVLYWSPWKSLDFIGVSAYFDLTRKNDPTSEELEQAWYEDANGQNIIEDLGKLSAEYGNCIVFWELGYQSKDGANQEPWNYVRPGPPDQGEQADAFAAAFTVLKDQPWLAGHIIWGEEPGLPKIAASYSVLDKEAGRTIRATHLGLASGVEVTFFYAGETTIGMFTNVGGAAVTGLHIEFDREVTIVNKIEFGGYLPATEELTGTFFDFAEGELAAGGMVELDWKPAEAMPILVQWSG